jgi:hypothetical protein
MRINKLIHDKPEVKSINEADNEAVILQANVVKQDIDQILMYLAANHDVNAIAQKMEQLGLDIADLYTCIHDAISVARHRSMPRHSSRPPLQQTG